MTSQDIKTLFNVPSGGYLAKHDQRFILNLKLTHQIMSHLAKTNKTNDKLLVELGPGAGALTRSLLTRPSFGVLGIELDSRYNTLLEQISTQTDGKFQWRNADVLSVDEFSMIKEVFPTFAERHERKPVNTGDQDGGAAGPMASAARAEVLRRRRQRSQSSATINQTAMEAADALKDLQWWANGDAKVEVIGNLPFSISTELLMRYAVDCSAQRGLYRFGRVPLHFFVQKEIAERLTATSNTPQFSRLSVLSQNFFRVAVRQTFTEMTYFPRTEVLGCLVTLEPRVAPLIDVNASVLINFLDLVMKPGMRNQMVSKALNRCMPQEVVMYILQELRIDGSVLPAQLSAMEVSRMARMWQVYLETTNQSQHHTTRVSHAHDGDNNGSAAAADQATHRNWHEEDNSETADHLNSTKKSSTRAKSTDAFQVERGFVSSEQEALDFDWEREERFARRKREQANEPKPSGQHRSGRRRTAA
jgi:16S rRNA A1518/A1519 N6-dimethyltransferase RsmA/KsgA/DIM1 with predicted DNA glycosylase/AP lyase activity